MGSSLTARTVVPNNWQQLADSRYRNLDTGEEVEVGEVVVPDGIIIDEYCEWYECRLSPSTRYVRVLFYTPKAALCCASRREILVLTERTHPLQRLQLSLEELVLVFQETLLGFRQLIATFGMFLISKEMIAVNEEGRVKVWVNNNFAQNHFTQEEDPKMTEEAVIDSLVSVIDARNRDGKRLDQAYRQFSKVRTFDNALAFIHNIQSRQAFQVRKVFLNREAFHDYRVRALREGNRQTLQHNRLADNFEPKLPQKVHQPEQPSSIPAERKKSRIVYAPSLQQKPVQAECSHQKGRVMKMSKVTSAPYINPPSINPARVCNPSAVQRGSAVGSLGGEGSPFTAPHRHSGGVPTCLPTHQPPAQIQRQSQPHQLKERSQLTTHKKRVDSTGSELVQPKPQPVDRVQQIAHKGSNPLYQTESTVNTSDIAQSLHRHTLNSKISNNSNNPANRHTYGGPQNNSVFLDWTLNRVSAPNLRQSNTMKKSDSERLVEFRQAEMYKSIPTVDSMIIISRSDHNDVVQSSLVEDQQPNYQLIESTIVRDLNSFSRFH